jgi:glycosyltransferase involved in cell wall biosynthesis
MLINSHPTYPLFDVFMIKILYFIVCLRPGGSDKYLLDLVKNLDPEQFQVTVWCEGAWGPAGDEMRKAGIKVIQQCNKPNRPLQILRAFRYIRRNHFDIVHTLKYRPNFVDPFVCRMSRVKVFITSRRNPRWWDLPPKLIFSVWLRNKMTDHVIANSVTSKQITEDVEHYPDSKISVIYTGIDLNLVDAITRESGQAFRNSLSIPSDAVVLGTVGDLREAKGQSYLVKAFADVVQRTSKDIYLVIQGEGPEEANLRELVKELKMESRIKISTTPHDQYVVMRSFDVFVLPSLTERLSNTLIAAMSLSLPCVASNAGGNSEVVVNNVSGLIVPAKSVEALAEAMLRLVEDPVLAKDFGAKGREIAEKKFTLPLMVSAHEQLYGELVKEA